MRLTSLYDCGCDNCKADKINLAASTDNDDQFKSVLNAAEKAFKYLHEKGGYNPKDINDDPYKDLTNKTFNVFNAVIQDNEIPPEMLSKLQNDAFIFSGLKTHAQLMEASSMLLDADGKVKGYEAFANDFNKINKDYNQNYLNAEYQFAIHSSQSAANWAALDPDGRYNLQYRTANDDRVREAHRVLQDITLPKDDIFWFSYYPPNGWRCRCTVVEVLKTKYELSDSKKALEQGEKATSQIGKDGKNKLEIFRFNPGAEQKVFPPKHPYNKVKEANVIKEELSPKRTPEKLAEYERKLGITVNKDIFKLLSKDTTLTFTNIAGVKNAGAYYIQGKEIVKIPLDKRRKQSKWKAESVVYHEFGHAADYQNNLKAKKEVGDIMKKYRKETDFQKVDKKLFDLGLRAYKNDNHDLLEKVGCVRDTLMALNPKYGAGHSAAYYKREGNKEAEFLAHAFENKFSGNEVFKKYLPELYEDTVKLIDGFISERQNQ